MNERCLRPLRSVALVIYHSLIWIGKVVVRRRMVGCQRSVRLRLEMSCASINVTIYDLKEMKWLNVGYVLSTVRLAPKQGSICALPHSRTTRVYTTLHQYNSLPRIAKPRLLSLMAPLCNGTSGKGKIPHCIISCSFVCTDSEILAVPDSRNEVQWCTIAYRFIVLSLSTMTQPAGSVLGTASIS